MVKTIQAPQGMSALQAVHAFVRDPNWQTRGYSKEARQVHHLLNTMSPNSDLAKKELEILQTKTNRPLTKELKAEAAQKAASRLVYDFAKEVFSKGNLTLTTAWEKPVQVNFANYPSLDVEAFDSLKGEGAASIVLNEYNSLPENRKVNLELINCNDIFTPSSSNTEQTQSPWTAITGSTANIIIFSGSSGLQVKLVQTTRTQPKTQTKVGQDGKYMGHLMLLVIAAVAVTFGLMQFTGE